VYGSIGTNRFALIIIDEIIKKRKEKSRDVVTEAHGQGLEIALSPIIMSSKICEVVSDRLKFSVLV
jgi:hypothetical protein